MIEVRCVKEMIIRTSIAIYRQIAAAVLVESGVTQVFGTLAVQMAYAKNQDCAKCRHFTSFVISLHQPQQSPVNVRVIE